MPPGAAVAPRPSDAGFAQHSLAPAPKERQYIITARDNMSFAGAACKEQGHQTGMLPPDAKNLSAAYMELCATVLAAFKTYEQQYKEMSSKTSAQRCLDALALSGGKHVEAAAHVESLTQLHAKCEEPDHKRIREQLRKIYNATMQRAAQARCMEAEMNNASAWTQHQFEQQLKIRSDWTKLRSALGMLQRVAQHCLKQQLDTYSKATARYFSQVRLQEKQCGNGPFLAPIPEQPSKVTPTPPHIVPLGPPQPPPGPSQAPPQPSLAQSQASCTPPTILPLAPPQPPPAPPASSNNSSYDNTPAGLNTSSSPVTPASKLPQASTIVKHAPTRSQHVGKSASQQLLAGVQTGDEPSKERRSLKRKTEQESSEEQPQNKRLASRPVTADQGAGHLGNATMNQPQGMVWTLDAATAQMGYRGSAGPRLTSHQSSIGTCDAPDGQQQQKRPGYLTFLLGSLKPTGTQAHRQAQEWRANVDLLMKHLPLAPDQDGFQPPSLDVLMRDPMLLE